MTERLRAELEAATAELRTHRASWAYAFAMAGGPGTGREHPVHAATRRRTVELERRRDDLRARIAEHEL